jgi:hypothetical protein
MNKVDPSIIPSTMHIILLGTYVLIAHVVESNARNVLPISINVSSLHTNITLDGRTAGQARVSVHGSDEQRDHMTYSDPVCVAAAAGGRRAAQSPINIDTRTAIIVSDDDRNDTLIKYHNYNHAINVHVENNGETCAYMPIIRPRSDASVQLKSTFQIQQCTLNMAAWMMRTRYCRCISTGRPKRTTATRCDTTDQNIRSTMLHTHWRLSAVNYYC